jgi:hypothetical protein
MSDSRADVDHGASAAGMSADALRASSCNGKTAMHRVHVLTGAASLVLVACGGRFSADDAAPGADRDSSVARSDASPQSDASTDADLPPIPTSTMVSGSVDGVTIVPAEVRSRDGQFNAVNETTLSFTNLSGICTRSPQFVIPQETLLQLELTFTTEPIGSYPIVSPSTVGYQHDGREASALLTSADGQCNEVLDHEAATSGFVIVTSSDPARVPGTSSSVGVTGTLHLVFAGGTLDGTFVSSDCGGMAMVPTAVECQ